MIQHADTTAAERVLLQLTKKESEWIILFC